MAVKIHAAVFAPDPDPVFLHGVDRHVAPQLSDIEPALPADGNISFRLQHSHIIVTVHKGDGVFAAPLYEEPVGAGRPDGIL